MKSFEREIREFLTKKHMQFDDNGSSFSKPDFKVYGKYKEAFIEAKEKRQKYNTQHWPIVDGKEHTTFILDELTARKLMLYPMNGCLFVRDNTTGLYYFSDPLSLWLTPRYRCNREMDKGHLKGKWMLDLRDFYGSDKIGDLFIFLRDYLDEAPGVFGRDHVECYRPDFHNEDPIEVFGTKRTVEQKEYDVEQTR